MNNKTHMTGNTLLWMVLQLYMDQFNPVIVKGAYPSVSEFDLYCEKVCVNYTNGDTFEYVVDDENNKVYVRFTLEQVKTKGKLVYHIPKWSDEFTSSQLSDYMAKLMHIIKNAYATYKRLYIRNKVYMVYV